MMGKLNTVIYEECLWNGAIPGAVGNAILGICSSEILWPYLD